MNFTAAISTSRSTAGSRPVVSVSSTTSGRVSLRFRKRYIIGSRPRRPLKQKRPADSRQPASWVLGRVTGGGRAPVRSCGGDHAAVDRDRTGGPAGYRMQTLVGFSGNEEGRRLSPVEAKHMSM